MAFFTLCEKFCGKGSIKAAIFTIEFSDVIILNTMLKLSLLCLPVFMCILRIVVVTLLFVYKCIAPRD